MSRRRCRSGRTVLGPGVTREPYAYGLIRVRVADDGREAEITCTEGELPAIVSWAAVHRGSTRAEPLPVEEYRRAPWGPEYRWTAAAEIAYRAAASAVDASRVTRMST